MHGSLNGVQLKRITALVMNRDGDWGRTTVGIIEFPKDLERVLRLNAPACLILSDQQIEGTIVQYSANGTFGYEITIESHPRA